MLALTCVRSAGLCQSVGSGTLGNGADDAGTDGLRGVCNALDEVTLPLVEPTVVVVVED